MCHVRKGFATRPILNETQTPLSDRYPGPQDFQRGNLPKCVLFLSPSNLAYRHIYGILLGPSRRRLRNIAFSMRVVKYCNQLPASLVISPSVSAFKNSWTANGQKVFLKHLRNLCSPSPTFYFACVAL